MEKILLLILLFVSALTIYSYIKYRKESFKLTPQSTVNELYYLLNMLDKTCRENDINYSITCGTLLGSERNGAMIAWDNDVDIIMEKVDFDNLKKIVDSKVLGDDIEIHYADFIYRFTRNKGAYIDVFIIEPFEGENTSKGNLYKYVEKENRDRFSKEYYYQNELYPLKDYTFGLLIVKGPNNAEVLLERMYGKNWKTPMYKCDKEYVLPD